MATHAANPNQALVNAWLVQMIGTVVLAGAVLMFFKSGVMPKAPGTEGGINWPLYALYAATAAIIPAMLYLRNFSHVLHVDRAAMQANGGVPDPTIRPVLMRALRVGGALSELPQAFGVLHLILGGETRWFLGATVVTIALRLSYRPFERKK
jgi:hypothetical protein